MSVEEVDYSSSDQVRVLKQQNMALQMKLEDIMKENESLMRVINQPSSHKHESSIREGHSHIRAWSHTGTVQHMIHINVWYIINIDAIHVMAVMHLVTFYIYSRFPTWRSTVSCAKGTEGEGIITEGGKRTTGTLQEEIHCCYSSTGTVHI